MKDIPIYDILFIIISGVILLLLSNSGYKEFFSDHIMSIVILSYFIGKYVRKIEFSKKFTN
jgi:hypothetical protein